MVCDYCSLSYRVSSMEFLLWYLFVIYSFTKSIYGFCIWHEVMNLFFFEIYAIIQLIYR